MIKKKICLLGAFSVGKTSLIQQFVESIFDDKYLTTIGVKITKKDVSLDDKNFTLMIWDLAGEDDYTEMKGAYLRGSAAYVVVVDATRPHTVDVALSLHERASKLLKNPPFVFAINKTDLSAERTITREQEKDLRRLGPVFETSAKTGKNVDELFLSITGYLS